MAVVAIGGETGSGLESRWPGTELAGTVLLLGIIAYAHARPLAAMVNQWNVSPMYSYGFSVPIVSAYLLWTRRAALRAITPRPSRIAGGVVLLLALTMLAAGTAAGIQVLQQVAFVVSLAGAVLFVLGTDYLRSTWAALAYLLLMVPLWDAFTEPLHAPFQQRSATICVWLLQHVGIPAHLDGTFVTLPHVRLEVARACSGVNYLVAVVALGLPMAYLYLTGVWRRAALLAFAIVVAALSNGVRVALIGVLAEFDIGSPLHGPFHVLHGLFVAGVGYMALFAGLRFLATPRPARFAPSRPVSRSPRRLPRVEAVSLAAVFILIGSGALAGEAARVLLDRGLDSLPLQVGRWHGQRGGWTSSVASMWPGADAQLHRRYVSDTGESVGLYVAYFERQEQDREIASFRSAPLLRTARPIQVAGPGGVSFPATLVSAERDRPELLYWYDVGSVVHATPQGAKIRSTWNALVHGHSNGAVVAITAVRSPLTTPDTSSAALQDFAWHVHQALAELLPSSSRRAR